MSVSAQGVPSAQEIQAMVERLFEERMGKGLPERPPRRLAIFHGKTGEPPPTADGLVWPIDAPEWVKESGYVLKRSEVRPPEKPKEAVPAGEDEIVELRKKFAALTGKPPGRRKRETLEAEIAEAEAAAAGEDTA